jgi:hypothetical protein
MLVYIALRGAVDRQGVRYRIGGMVDDVCRRALGEYGQTT